MTKGRSEVTEFEGICESLIAGDKDFEDDEDPAGRSEMNVDWSDTTAPKAANVETSSDH